MAANQPEVSNRRKTLLRLNTTRFTSDPRSLKSRSDNLDKMLEKDKYSIGEECDLNESLKPAISAFIDYNVTHGSNDLQKKVDYYITPYNQELDFTNTMLFADKMVNWRNLKDVARKDWRLISNFILKSTRKEFRGNLNALNNELYDNLKELACSLIKQKSPNVPSRNSESNRNSNTLKFRGIKKFWLGKKRNFKKGLEESFNAFQRLSFKELPMFIGENFNKRKNFQAKYEGSFSELSQLKLLKSEIKVVPPQKIEDGTSVISPLMKIFRSHKESQERKENKRIQNENMNRFKINFSEIKPLPKISDRNKSKSTLTGAKLSGFCITPIKIKDSQFITNENIQTENKKVYSSEKLISKKLSSVQRKHSTFEGQNPIETLTSSNWNSSNLQLCPQINNQVNTWFY